MTELRTFDPLARADALLGLWNDALGDRFPLDDRLLGQQLRLCSDERLCLGAFDSGGRLVGAALAKRSSRPGPDGSVPATGCLSFMLVAEGARRRGLGSALLGRCEAWLSERGALRLHLGRDPYHFFPGQPLDGSPGSEALAAFLDARGFEPGNAEHDLVAVLGKLDLPALARRSPLAPGFRVRPYEASLRAGVEAFFLRCFPGRWRLDTLEAIAAGMRGGDLLLLEEEASGSVVGFSRIYDGGSPVLGPGVYWRGLMGGHPGGLGPIGVDESRRGRGLGLALLRVSMEELAGRGVRTMVIDWTDLVDFYAKMGFSVWKSYRLRSKRLGQHAGPS